MGDGIRATGERDDRVYDIGVVISWHIIFTLIRRHSFPFPSTAELLYPNPHYPFQSPFSLTLSNPPQLVVSDFYLIYIPIIIPAINQTTTHPHHP
jgi:hypothetical protein